MTSNRRRCDVIVTSTLIRRHFTSVPTGRRSVDFVNITSTLEFKSAFNYNSVNKRGIKFMTIRALYLLLPLNAASSAAEFSFTSRTMSTLSSKPGPEVIKLFSCSTQLSMKFPPLINVKMPTIVGILTCMSGKNNILGLTEP